MGEELVLHRVCALIESAITESGEDNASRDGASSSSRAALSGAALSDSIVSELYDVLGDGHSSVAKDLDSGFWNELVERRVCLSALVGALKCTMEKGGKHGLKAAGVYLGLLLVDGCPLYSVFNPLSFQVLVQCVRSCCFSTQVVPRESRKRKGKGKKGTRTPVTQSQQDDMEAEWGLEQPSQGLEQEQQGRKESASLHDVFSIMGALQRTLEVLSLKEHPDTLKVLVELVVNMPLLMADLAEEDDETGASRGAPKARKLHAKSGPTSIWIMSFSILRGLLEASHGDLMKIAVIILQALAPGILCTQAAGSPHQKGQFRGAALEFVSRELLASNRNIFCPAVIAFTRYLCRHPPEKAEGRTIAVEAVVTVVKALGPSEWSEFGGYVAKLSRGKPPQRLLAIDIGLAMFGKLPAPFEGDAAAYTSSPRTCREESDNAKDHCDPAQEATTCKPREGNAAAPSAVSPPWGVPCIEAILGRCIDVVPTIRARALSNLGQVVELLSDQVRCRVHLQTLLGFRNPSDTGNNGCHVETQGAVDNRDTPVLAKCTSLVDESAPSASHTAPGAGYGYLGRLLKTRCQDEKAGVRKSALFLLKKSVSLSGRPPDEATLRAMGNACADPLVSIRKAALSALTEVMRKFPADQAVMKEWLQCALPLAVDNETSLQDECLDVFQEMVLDKVAAAVSTIELTRERKKGAGLGVEDTYTDLERMLPHGILYLLKGMADGGDVASCVHQICTGLGKKKRVKPAVAKALQAMINASGAKSRRRKPESAPQGAWMLLAEVSAFVPKAVDWGFLRPHWQLLEKQDRSKRTPGGYSCQAARSTPYSCSEGLGDGFTDKKDSFVSAAWAADRVHLLQTIANIALELPEEAVYSLASELLAHLEAFNMHPAEVAGHVTALSTLCRRKADAPEQGEELVSTWVKTLLKKAGVILQSFVSESTFQRQEGGKMDSFITPEIRSKRKTRACTPSEQIVTVVFTIGAIVIACPSEKPGHIVTLLQALVAPDNAPGKEIGGDRSSFVKGVAPEISVQVWVTLGKLCLADNSLAKRCIPLFMQARSRQLTVESKQELDRSESAAVRNNIMFAMTDFCMRYTALVDGYMHTLTKTLQDPCELVRRQAFVLLARLLQRDYLKWRGMMFHRFLLTLVDDSPKIRQLATYLVGTILRVKAPLLAYNSFVETVFVLNDCHGHSGSSSALKSSERDRKLFSLRGNGETVSERRMSIYIALLQQMGPEHLIYISMKLSTEILGGAADGLLNIADPSAQCVIEDAFKILASKEMRIASKNIAVSSEGLDTEDDGGQAATVAAAKGRVVTHLMKKNLVHIAIPRFIELKKLLESKNSPLLGMLMECLRILLKEYKSEIEEMLVADKQLQREIMYDIQKHEATKAREKVAAAAAVIASVPGAEAEETTKPGPLRDAVPSEVRGASVRRTPTSGKPRLEDLEELQGVDADKENSHSSAQKGAGAGAGRNVESSASRILRPSTVKKRAATTGSVEKAAPASAQPSPRVTWLDQTPGYLRPGCPPSSEGDPVKTTHREPTAKRLVMPVTPSSCIRAPGIPSPNNPFHGATPAAYLVGAVADVAASATAAAVLREVASNTTTPLKGMLIPKLRTPLSAESHGSAARPQSGDRRVALREAGIAGGQQSGSFRSKQKPPQPQSGSARRTRSQQT